MNPTSPHGKVSPSADAAPASAVRYAAFLRGINLGRRRVTGEELCTTFRNLGFEDVASFLASGNVVLMTRGDVDADALAHRIEAGLHAALGYDVPVFLRTSTQLAGITAQSPFTEIELARSERRHQVMLLRSAPDGESIEAALAHASSDDRLVIAGTEVHWLPARGMSDSGLDLNALTRLLGPTTIRTARTLARLQAKHFPHEHGTT